MTRVIVAIVVTALLALGVRGWNAHLIAQGDERGAARVLAEWDAWMAKNAAIAERQRADAERTARAKETAKQQEAERIARDQAQREASRRAAVDSLNARNRSLLGSIAALNARLADLSGAATDPRLAAVAREAATARELLGSCSVRYAAVAADADGLRDQVNGLLDFVAIDQQAQ